jgi:hypothetical protein
MEVAKGFSLNFNGVKTKIGSMDFQVEEIVEVQPQL